MNNDPFLKDIREIMEIRLYQIQYDHPGERVTNHLPPDMVQTYLFLALLERLESIDNTLVVMLNPLGEKHSD